MTLKSHTYLYYSQLLVVASLPFHFLISSYVIGLLLLLFIINIFKSSSFRKEIFASLKSNKIAHLLVLFFIAYVVSTLIHISDYSAEMPPLEKKLSFLVFPFLFANISTYKYQQIQTFLKVFIGSILLSTIIALSVGVYYTLSSGTLYYFDEGNGVVFNNFMYHRLGSYVGMHAVYFAEYVLVAFILWISYAFYHFKLWSLKHRLLSIGLGFYFIGVIFLLKSASILIILVVIISLFTIYHLFKAREKVSGKLKWVIFITGVVVVSLLTYRAVDKIGSKANFFTYDLSQPGGGEWNAINLRLAKWHVAKMTIKDHWFLGVGPGNTVSTLDKYYEKVGFDYALQLHYNPHNQFLHTFLTLGIFGVALLSLIFLLAIFKSLKKKDSVMFLFLISFLLFSMSESTLAVNKGIVFFAVFLSLLSYLPQKTSYYLNEQSNKE